jgi:von Willebrand factor type A domain
MVAGDGSLDVRFDEVVLDPPLTQDYRHTTGWPDPSSPEVPGYPLSPHQLTEGDWVYGNTGFSMSNDVGAALDYHIANRTVLNLPIVDKVVGGGRNTYIHFLRMGAFYLRGYSQQGGGNAYLDLVYIGASSKTACLRTNVNQGLKGLGITGQAFLNPRWQLSQGPAQPIAYQIVLDVSGSMSWDFAGHGTVNGTNYQCEINTPGDPLPYYGDSNNDEACPQPFDWQNVQERRVYIAKNAIFNFINKMDANDTMRVITYTSTGNPPRGVANSPAGWSGNKATLINTVRNAGARNGDPWATTGGTPSAQGLQEARRLLLASNGFPAQAPNGQPYKPVVIFFTDGVANFFLDGRVNTARDVCNDMTISRAYTTPYPCQVGYTSNGTARPIYAMIDQANGIKSDNPALSLYVVGLGNVPETGLDRVASDSSMFFLATAPNLVDDILTKINAQVEGSTCTPTGGFQWIDSVDSAHTPSNPPFNLPSGTFGYVYIYEPNGAVPKYTLPIQNDPASGKLSFSIPPPDPANPSSTGITPGTYEMEAYIGYKGGDGVSRQYDWFINQNNLTGANRITFAVTSAATLGRSVALDPIFLDLKQAARVCPTGP